MATTHYVNNPDFLAALKEHKIKCKEAADAGLEKPQASNYIGECILKIANHLSYKPNFINYTYREEMISDGIENSLMYMDNFDPEKGSNPFAYFTQIIFFAFIRRIQKEKKQTLIKGKIIMEMPFTAFDIQDHDDDGTYVNSYIEFMRNHDIYSDVIVKEEARKEKIKSKKSRANLDEILESDEIIDTDEV